MNNIERVTGPKIKVKIADTIRAIDRIGKNKAASADELLDIIFQVKEWKKLELKLIKDNMMRKDWKKDYFQNTKEYKRDKEDIVVHSG